MSSESANLTPGLILASTSPYRRALLERLGIAFEWQAPRLDEDELKPLVSGLDPHRMASFLAGAKADSLVGEFPDHVILGGDQLVALDGEILGKPGSIEAAVGQLARMAGRTHELVTAIVLAGEGVTETYVDVARLTMRRLSRVEIERYVEADHPIDCAGSYKLESRGIVLFDRIECADHSAITGLPLMALTSMLRSRGFAIP